jgi:putative transposase
MVGKDSADAEGINGGPSKAFVATRWNAQYCSGEHFVAKIKSARVAKTQHLPRQISLLSCTHPSKIDTMQRLQAFRYELRPNGEQRLHMGRFAGSRRFVYNKALALQKTHYEAGGTFIGYVAMAKLGWVRYRNSREMRGVAKNITVSASGGKWFASIQTVREVEQPVPSATGAVGIDMGIARLATLSDGSFVEPLNSFKQQEAQLRRSQRALSRKTKFSQNWQKAKRRVQRIHIRIGNCRRDFLHKATTTISKNHAMVCIEDLQVKNMSRSAKGNAENPGKNVRAKSGLNKSILDQGWSEFRRQLQYKLNWNGAMLVAVPPHHTSLTCPECDRVAAENRPTQAQFRCVECGYENHADVVGAMNILARGYRVVACGEEGSGLGRKTRTKPTSVKQEPTEVTMGEVAHA